MARFIKAYLGLLLILSIAGIVILAIGGTQLLGLIYLVIIWPLTMIFEPEQIKLILLAILAAPLVIIFIVWQLSPGERPQKKNALIAAVVVIGSFVVVLGLKSLEPELERREAERQWEAEQRRIAAMPLVEAARRGNLDVMKARLDEGADFEARDDYRGYTALMHAVDRQLEAAVTLLIEAGADLDAQVADDSDTSPGLTALMRAASSPHGAPVVQLLIDAGADVNLARQDGHTALTLSAGYRAPSTTRILLAAGANVEARSDVGHTALNIAAANGFTATVRELLTAGADVNTQTNNGWSPLLRAARHGRPATVTVLLAAGADLTARTSRGLTALNTSAAHGQTETVRVLLAAGANVDAQSNNGWSPLARAARYGHTATVTVLLAAGADLNLKNNDGDTALSLALKHEYTETAEVLKEAERR